MKKAVAFVLSLLMVVLVLMNTITAIAEDITFDKTIDILIPLQTVKNKIKDSLILCVGSQYAAINGSKKVIDRKNKEVRPLIRNGRVFVPIRFIAETYGANVTWDAVTQTATIVIGKDTVVAQVGNKDLKFNDKPLPLDVSPFVENDRVFLPLRAISEALGKTVFWSDWGLIAIGDQNSQKFDVAQDKYMIPEIIRYLAIDANGAPKLDGINVEGKPLEGFKQDIHSYLVDVLFVSNVLPKIEGISSKYKVEMKEAATKTDTTEISVTDDETAQTGVYTIHYRAVASKPEQKKRAVFTVPSGLDEFKAFKVSTSSVPQPENPPENAVDGDLKTSSTTNGIGEWFQFEFNEEKTVGAVGIAFKLGDVRTAFFEIQLSTDGNSWKKALVAESCGKSNDKEIFTFKKQQAKYVRIVGYGTTQGIWNNIAEASVYGE